MWNIKVGTSARGTFKFDFYQNYQELQDKLQYLKTSDCYQ